MFAAPDEPKKSKIFQALNPEKLWYESRREKEEAREEAVHITIRGGGAGFTRSSVDFAVERDNEGNIVASALEGVYEEDEEDFDPNNLVSNTSLCMYMHMYICMNICMYVCL